MRFHLALLGSLCLAGVLSSTPRLLIEDQECGTTKTNEPIPNGTVSYGYGGSQAGAKEDAQLGWVPECAVCEGETRCEQESVGVTDGLGTTYEYTLIPTPPPFPAIWQCKATAQGCVYSQTCDDC